MRNDVPPSRPLKTYILSARTGVATEWLFQSYASVRPWIEPSLDAASKSRTTVFAMVCTLKALGTSTSFCHSSSRVLDHIFGSGEHEDFRRDVQVDTLDLPTDLVHPLFMRWFLFRLTTHERLGCSSTTIHGSITTVPRPTRPAFGFGPVRTQKKG